MPFQRLGADFPLEEGPPRRTLLRRMTPQNSTQSYLVNKSSRASQKMPKKMGHVSFLAGCSTVNYHGDVLYDEYILPPCYIVDYWTRWSSIWKHHIQILKIQERQRGHTIHNFKALQYFHSKSLTHDTSHTPFFPNQKSNCLKNATMSLNGHSSVEHAQATMELYKLVEVEWEQHLAHNPPKD
ncbi:unnamed protein product [Nyctereutes procyonoides]|uniref:(raccoon dog) hypothetical protein n=1 Tax=Nyctereutes procyonoides TaxID=34880 RepID=A0A811Z4M5_NYCPR|nr:unnamed protein product [Nyctereutes procyonoides]